MKIRNKSVKRQLVCSQCKADMVETVTPAYGKLKDTHEVVSVECHVCGHGERDRLVPKKPGGKTNADGTGSLVGKLVGMGF